MDDLIVWPDGTYCTRSDFHEMSFMSDDYEILPYLSEEYNIFLENLEEGLLGINK